ncbi:hypothetical protein PG988_003261 [Apiospora saccharicola]
MSDKPPNKPSKSDKGQKANTNPPLDNDDRLILEMLRTMGGGFSMSRWAEVAALQNLTPDQAKQRFEKMRNKFLAEDASGTTGSQNQNSEKDKGGEDGDNTLKDA